MFQCYIYCNAYSMLGKCPNATAIYQCVGKSCDGKQKTKRKIVRVWNELPWPWPPTNPPWQGFDQSIGIKGRPIKRAKELIFDQIGFEARYISSSCKRVACQEVTPCGYIKRLWRVEMVKYLNVIKMRQLWLVGIYMSPPFTPSVSSVLHEGSDAWSVGL